RARRARATGRLVPLAATVGRLRLPRRRAASARDWTGEARSWKRAAGRDRRPSPAARGERARLEGGSAQLEACRWPRPSSVSGGRRRPGAGAGEGEGEARSWKRAAGRDRLPSPAAAASARDWTGEARSWKRAAGRDRLPSPAARAERARLEGGSAQLDGHRWPP